MVLLSPFLSLVPSFVIETVVTRWCCTAAIPIRRLPERRRLGPLRDPGEKNESREKQEAEASWPRRCGSQSQLHRAQRSRNRCRSNGNFRCCPSPVRSFETFTHDLHRLKQWLQQCRITTVAIESTGVYWIPLFQILEEAGLEVCLVNAQHVKHVPGRKSDGIDCQWLQYLHSVGLLRASFRPEDRVCVIRSLLRHRDSLVQ